VLQTARKILLMLLNSGLQALLYGILHSHMQMHFHSSCTRHSLNLTSQCWKSITSAPSHL